MSRSYATLDCGIWDEESGFCALSAGAQRTYFMLVSQRTIAACGTLALTIRRWGRMCAEDDIQVWLKELSEARYVIVDDDTEELLVRTFVKWDGGYKHPQRLKAVLATAKAIQSRPIRAAMVEELARVGLSSPYEVAPESHSDATGQAPSSGRFRSEYLSTAEPGTSSLDPSTVTPEREPFDASDEPLSMFCKQHPTGTEEPCGPCGTAIRRYKAAAATKLEAEVSAKRAAAEARANCGACNEHGFKLDPKTRQPAGRCNHEIEVAS